MQTRELVAIVGLSGRFPGAQSVDEFWRKLCQGEECIRRFSEAELEAAGVKAAKYGRTDYVRARPCVERSEWFDAEFFGYNAREAEWLDPQHRLFLECAWEALEDAACDPKRFPGWIGVFAGASLNTYLLNNLRAVVGDFETSEGLQLLIASDKDYLATRVSYKLDLRGPSVTLQTACSTGLVAVHQACRSLLDFECDLALAGATSISVPGHAGYRHERGGINSPDGHCRPFDAQARGTVFGDAVGVVALKRLEDALRDGDFVHAVILGSAINNDGAAKVGYTAPSVEGQASVVALAQEAACVDSSTIGFIEAHGTGTSLGDPIEVRALERAFGRSKSAPQRCALGSVKSNVGHTNTAAGIVGFIKAVLAVKYGQIPPTLHYHEPNPEIPLANSRFYVNTTLTEWVAGDAPRRAGVSSFGVGGTNAHVVLEQAQEPERTARISGPELLLLSARTPNALQRMRHNLADALDRSSETSLADVAFTLREGRTRFAERVAIVANDMRQASERLRATGSTCVASGTVEPAALLFTGQGSPYPGMVRSLYEDEPFVRQLIDDCATRLMPELGFSLCSALFDSDGARLSDTAVQQPALFVVEVAVARWLQHCGLPVGALVGHSIGEWAAACCAGVFELAEALRLVALRGRLMRELPKGAMCSVALAETQLLERLPRELDLAAVNASGACVVAGVEADVARFEADCERQGVATRRLRTERAFHSRMTDSVLETFERAVAQSARSAPVTPIASNVTGAWLSAEAAQSAHYWVEQLRRTVRFSDCLATVNTRPVSLLLEVGPGRTLCTLARSQLAVPTFPVLNGAFVPERESALGALGEAWARGHELNWSACARVGRGRRVPLPTYPFERRRCWVEPTNQASTEVASLDDELTIQRTVYQSSGRLLTGIAEQTDSNWLVLGHVNDPVVRDLCSWLRERGAAVCNAQPGAKFTLPDANTIELDPACEQDWVRAFEILAERGHPISRVVHAVSLDLSGSARDRLQRSFFSAAALVRAASRQSLSVELSFLTRGTHAVCGEVRVVPENATLLGFARSVVDGRTVRSARVVDLAVNESAALGVSSAELVAELLQGSEPHVLLRGRQRWAPERRAVAMQAVRPTLLEPGGAYVITGGTSGVGFALAQHLVREWHARVALIGKTRLPDRAEWSAYRARPDASRVIAERLDQLQALEAEAADLLIVSADVSLEAEVARAFAAARQRFGRIDGVFHCAGVPGGPLDMREMEEQEAVVLPKTLGTAHVTAQLAESGHGFLVLFSSTFGEMGAPGQPDYAAASSALAAYGASYQAQTGRPAITVAWDGWREVGMAAAAGLTRAGQLPPGPFAASTAVHPLLDRHEVEESGVWSFSKMFHAARDWCVAEHRLLRKCVVPGSAFIEMVRAAAKKMHAGPCWISNLRFRAACRVDDAEPCEVQLSIKREGERHTFQIQRAHATGPELLVTGELGWLFVAGSDPAKATPESLEEVAANILFEAVNQSGMVAWGPRWKVVSELRVGKDTAWARCRLPEPFTRDLDAFELHPAALDVATAIATCLDREAFYLPDSYSRIEILGALPSSFESCVRVQSRTNDELCVEVTLRDYSGAMLVRIDGFTLRRVRTGVRAAAAQVRGIEPKQAFQALELALCDATPELWVVAQRDALRAAPKPPARKVAESAADRPDANGQAPTTEIERILLEMWQELLGQPSIGIHDGFFDVGGHSLLAVQLLSRIREQFDIVLEISDVFAANTVAGLAQSITQTLIERLNPELLTTLDEPESSVCATAE